MNTTTKTVAKAAAPKAAPKAAKRAVGTSPADLHRTSNVALAAGAKRIADPRQDVQPGKEDQKIGDKFVYLAAKAPSDLHEDMAEWISRVTGVPFTPEMVKAVQLTAVLRHDYQKSNWNQTREAFRGLPEEVCDKRSEHMILAHVEARAILEAKAEAEAKAAEQAAKKAAAPARRTKATPANVPAKKAS